MATTSKVRLLRNVYKTAILLIVLFGLIHIFYTFYAYKELQEPALWFFSGALVLLLNAGLNHLNLSIHHKIIFSTCLASNIGVSLFCIVLAWVIPEIQTRLLAIILLLTTSVSIVYKGTYTDETQ